MNKEITTLTEEMENYRNRMMAFYWNVPMPRKITYNWDTFIEPANLYSSGEDGAYAYTKSRRLGEQSLIYFAIQADNKGHIKMANGFWEQAYLKSKSSSKSFSPKKRKNDSTKVQQLDEQKIPKLTTSFHEFWFTLVREQRKYTCYSIFFVLPSNKEAIRYLTDFSEDLKIISSPSTLVMTLGSDQHLHVSVDGENISIEMKGDYARVARAFGIDFTLFPCMVVFEGINSSNRTPVIFKGIAAEEISEKMKAIFSIIQDAVAEKKSILESLQKHQHDERLKHTGRSVVGKMQGFLGFTYKIIIEKLTEIYAPKSSNQ